MVRKISGKQSTPKISHLHFNGTEVTDVSDIVNTLAETFCANNSSEQDSIPFKPTFNKASTFKKASTTYGKMVS